MKKNRLLNSHISRVIAEMGHTDSLCIADAGLPIPAGSNFPERVDLAVSPGIPAFLDVLRAVLSEMAVEKIVVAQETQEQCALWPSIGSEFLNLQNISRHDFNTMITRVPHEEFKKLTHASRAILRTGECTRYTNIILYSGVAF